MRSRVVVAYARSDADAEMLRPHVKPRLVMHDRGDDDAGARIIRSLTDRGMIVLVVKVEDMPALIADEIRGRGGEIMTLDKWLASEGGRGGGRDEMPFSTPEYPSSIGQGRQDDPHRNCFPLGGGRPESPQDFGEAGLNTPIRARLSNHVRDAVRAALEAGQGIKSIARAHGIDPASVRRIKRESGQ